MCRAAHREFRVRSRQWVCATCHPPPWRLCCFVRTRQEGFWERAADGHLSWVQVFWREVPSAASARVAGHDGGRERADKAIARAGANAPVEWMGRALDAVQSIAARRPEFTTDAVWYLVGAPPEPRAMGAVMKQAEAVGLCVPTDRHHPSVRPECHARPLRVWRSLVSG